MPVGAIITSSRLRQATASSAGASLTKALERPVSTLRSTDWHNALSTNLSAIMKAYTRNFTLPPDRQPAVSWHLLSAPSKMHCSTPRPRHSAYHVTSCLAVRYVIASGFTGHTAPPGASITPTTTSQRSPTLMACARSARRFAKRVLRPARRTSSSMMPTRKTQKVGGRVLAGPTSRR